MCEGGAACAFDMTRACLTSATFWLRQTAAENGHKGIVEKLLQAGAPWNAQDNDGYCAGEYAGKHPEIVELLLEWGVRAEMLLGAAARWASTTTYIAYHVINMGGRCSATVQSGAC